MGLTERLYYTDSKLLEFRAKVLDVSVDGLRVSLDRSAFYPTSGGQPHDTGTLNGIDVVDVVDEDDNLVHVLALPLTGAEDAECRVDAARRFDHMQQHSGQHLLSAVFEALFGFKTLSFHMGAESSTVDLAVASLDPDQVKAVERRANEAVFENRPLAVTFQDSSEAQGLRKESQRAGTLRIVSIDGLDRSACGGTHVASSGEIGPILLRKLDKIRGNVRVEFLCGTRAIQRARADYDALSGMAKLLSSSLDDVSVWVAAQLEQAKESDKARRKLGLELAGYRGRELYAATEPDAAGRRVHLELGKSGALDDEVRALAQSYCGQTKAVFLAASQSPVSVLLAASADSGIHAGNLMKEALAAAGGRGGGNAQMAQGSLPDPSSLETVVAKLVQ